MTDQLQPGPEADRRVALEVMGWKKRQHYWYHPDTGLFHPDGTARLCSEWRPTTDPAASKEVRCRLVALEWQWALSYNRKERAHEPYCFHLSRAGIVVKRWAKTEEMAVAEAALAAVGGRMGEHDLDI